MFSKAVSQIFQSKDLTLVLSFIVVFVLIGASGCASSSGRDARKFAEAKGFSEVRFETKMFTLCGWFRPATSAPLGRGAMPGLATKDSAWVNVAGVAATVAEHKEAATAEAEPVKTLRIFLEGDGRAWRTRTQPSEDPTPRDPVALRLAVADTGTSAVLYLARPCQYARGQERRNCEKRYWTTARLGQDVLESLDEAVSQAKSRYKAEKIVLVGFSGGGGAAALLAARRQDVVFLGTVAGNLDSDTWTQLHGVSSMTESLNPLSNAMALRGLPQRHLSSRGDAVVPPLISAGFCRAIGQPEACIVLDGVSHDGPWENYWDYEFAKIKN